MDKFVNDINASSFSPVCVFCKSNVNTVNHATLYCSGKLMSEPQCYACLTCVQNTETASICVTENDKYLMCPCCNYRILSYSYQNDKSVKIHRFDADENILNYFSGTGGLKFGC